MTFLRLPLTFLSALFCCLSAQPGPWVAQPKKAALMVVIAHPDDEIGWLGGTLTYYAGVRKLPVICVVMTNKGTVRETEMQNACWIYGMRNKPIFAPFADACLGSDLACNWQAWGGRNKADEYLTKLVRTYKPDVLISMDLNGEYGHPNHMGTAFASMDAFYMAPDKLKFPEQLDSLTPWQPRKLYLHGSAISYHEWCKKDPQCPLCMNCIWKVCRVPARSDAEMKYFPLKPKLATWYHTWMMTSPALNGRTVFAVTNEGGNCHKSQKANNWCAPGHVFDLLDSKAGTDSAFNDLFEHLDTTVYFNKTPAGFILQTSPPDQHLIYCNHSLKIPNSTAVSERPSVEIRSLAGTLIASPQVTAASGGWEAKLDATTVRPGIYLAIVHYNGITITRRIIRR